MKYTVDLEQVTLEEAIDLFTDDLTVFYTYNIGRPIYLLTKDALAAAIKNKAIYLTPCSFVMKKVIE